MTDPTLDFVLDRIAELEAEATEAVTPTRLAAAFNAPDVNEAARYLMVAGYQALRLKHAQDARFKLKRLELTPEEYKAILAPRAHHGRDRSKERNSNLDRMTARQKRTAAELQASAARIEQALGFYQTWRLATGKALGEATKADLLMEVRNNKSTATGLLQNADFYQRLADKLKAKQTVAAAIPLSEAHRIREACFADA